MELNRCYVGDCRDILKQMAAAGVRVQTCVTSPPYWGLRDYGIPPSVWGGDPHHVHEWGEELTVHKGGPQGDTSTLTNRGAHQARTRVATYRAGQFCACGAWLGSLGLEPDHHMFVDHMVEVFELVREVLADDGTLWLNLGDSYANDRGQHISTTLRRPRAPAGWTNRAAPPRGVRPTGSLKPKDLCMIPARVALALQDAGWWVRSDIIWSKPNPMPESATDRPTKSHEYLFLLAKSEVYHCDMAAIREPASPGTHERYQRGRSESGRKWADGGPGGQTIDKTFDHMKGPDVVPQDWATTEGFVPKPIESKWKQPDGWDTGAGAHGSIHRAGREKGKKRKLAATGSGTKNNTSFDEAMAVMPDDRNKRSVWTVTTEAFAEAHFATFPRKLIEPCILAGARKGELVLDPFMGSGTTAQVAEHLGRQWIGCEQNEAYLGFQTSRLMQRAIDL